MAARITLLLGAMLHSTWSAAGSEDCPAAAAGRSDCLAAGCSYCACSGFDCQRLNQTDLCLPPASARTLPASLFQCASPGFAVLDPSAYAGRLGDDFDWAQLNVPFVDLEDPDLQTAYYYRWRSYRKHIGQDPASGRYVVTEFLPRVPWAGKDNTIPAAAGHHIAEGRWMHDERILNDYISFWYTGGGNPYSYTNWIGWAALQRFKLNGNLSFAAELLPDLVSAFPEYIHRHLNNQSKCWWQSAGADAMEVAISGDGCRPTIASAMFGEAAAILEFGNLTDRLDQSTTSQFEQWADFSKELVLNRHWNPQIECFAVITGVKGPGLDSGTACSASVHQPSVATVGADHVNGSACCAPVTNSSPTSQTGCCARCRAARGCQGFSFEPSSGSCWLVRWPGGRAELGHAVDRVAGVMPGVPIGSCDLAKIRLPGQPAQVRELLGFMPWYFISDTSKLINSTVASRYAPMFKQLFDSSGGFGGRYGLTVAERRSPCWNYSWSHGDTWNQNSWPYETARVLTSMANVLNELPGETNLTRTQYMELLVQYAQQHTKTYAVNDTAHPAGSGHIFENLHPDLGYWNNRARMYWANNSNKNMGDDYNHSTFIDLILSGLLGIRPRRDTFVSINPLITDATHFAVDHVRCKGRYLAVVFDVDGTHYDKRFKPGLSVLVDGRVAAHAPTLGRPLMVDMA